MERGDISPLLLFAECEFERRSSCFVVENWLDLILYSIRESCEITIESRMSWHRFVLSSWNASPSRPGSTADHLDDLL